MGRHKKYIATVEPEPEGLIGKEIYFLGNCIYWLKEFNESRVAKSRVEETLDAIRTQVASIETKLK